MLDISYNSVTFIKGLDPRLDLGFYSLGGRGTLNVKAIGMLVRNFLANSKKYPDFDFTVVF